jgi:hypothetical protein
MTPQVFRQPKVKVRCIGEHSYIRLLRHDGPDKLAILAIHPRYVRKHLHQARHGEGSRIDDRTNPRSLHARTGASEEFGIRHPRAECIHHARGIQVPGRFAGRNEDTH